MKKDLQKILALSKRQDGQAAIEFIVVIVVVFFFLLFYLSLAITLVVSQYIDYATFMAARTYKAGSSFVSGSRGSQEDNARLVFQSYFENINGIARNPQFEIVQIDNNDTQSEGVLVSYDIDLFYLPPLFLGGDGPPSRIRLLSQAHLGRDPSFNECRNFFANFSAQFSLGLQDALLEEMADNGC